MFLNCNHCLYAEEGHLEKMCIALGLVSSHHGLVSGFNHNTTLKLQGQHDPVSLPQTIAILVTLSREVESEAIVGRFSAI